MSRDSGRRRFRSWLDATASVCMIAVSVVLLARLLWPTDSPRPVGRQRPEIPLPTVPFQIGDSPVKGASTAEIVMFEYSDFQCPFCSRFARETLPLFEREFIAAGKTRLVFRHFPLPTHSLAMKASRIAECASRHGKFWQVHDALFADLSQLAAATSEPAMLLGFAPPQLSGCFDDQATMRIERDVAEAKAAGVSSTPTFLIGRIQQDGSVRAGKRLVGARPMDEFRVAIDEVSKARR